MRYLISHSANASERFGNCYESKGLQAPWWLFIMLFVSAPVMVSALLFSIKQGQRRSVQSRRC